MNASSDRFDPVRQRIVADGPEEAVRQAFLRFLIEDRGIPRGLISVETRVAVPGTPSSRTRGVGRTDIVVHDRNGRPWMLVECKAPEIALDQKVWNQAAAYNRALDARYVLVTNGRRNLCADVVNTDAGDARSSVDDRPAGGRFLDDFPTYPGANDRPDDD